MPDIGRSHPTHGVHERLGEPTLVFLTVNTKNRERRLDHIAVQRALEHIWSCEAKAWLVGDFVILPDHLHLFCAPASFPAEFSIEAWMKFWKSRASKALGWGPGAWQRDGFHHRIRNAADYEEKWQYFRNNPVKAGLADTFEEWPFRGCVHRLEWGPSVGRR